MMKTIFIAGAILLALAIIVPVAIYYSSDAINRRSGARLHQREHAGYGDGAASSGQSARAFD